MPAINRFALAIATLTVLALAGDSVRATVAKSQESASFAPLQEKDELHAVRGYIKKRGTMNAVSLNMPIGILPVVDQPDILPRHKSIADAILRLMPKNCLGTLKQFYVRYDSPETRGLAGKSTLIVSGNVSDDEFRALFLHEFTHVMDLGCLQGKEASGNSTFRDGNEIFMNDDPSVEFYSISWLHEKVLKKNTTVEDFVSGYARWDAFEDMSETVTAYVLHREGLLELAKRNATIAKKVAWVQRYIFPHLPSVATSTYAWGKAPPWDTTKIPYTWLGNQLVGSL